MQKFLDMLGKLPIVVKILIFILFSGLYPHMNMLVASALIICLFYIFFIRPGRRVTREINNAKIINNYNANAHASARQASQAAYTAQRQNINMHNQTHNDFMQQEMIRQQNEWAMEETRKAGTPFDMGGYLRGDGLNPSDTAAADAARQAEQMNNMNNMGGMGMF